MPKLFQCLIISATESAEPGFLSVYNWLANHFRSPFVAHLTSQTVRLSELWQTLENHSLCFCFSHPSLPKFSSLWLGGRRFPNKLAETCCLWVRPSSPPAGHQSCHPQCKQVALASQGEWVERVGVTQATPIQNSQLTSKNQGYGCDRSSSTNSSFGLSACIFSLAAALLFCQLHSNIQLNKDIFYILCFTLFESVPMCLSLSVFLSVFALWGAV